MKKTFLALVMVMTLGGCQSSTSTPPPSFTKVNERVLCIDGVSYFMYDRGITVMLDQNSKVIPCQQ